MFTWMKISEIKENVTKFESKRLVKFVHGYYEGQD